MSTGVTTKPSGIPWLGEVPAHWQVKRLKNLARKPIKNGVGESADHEDPEWPRYIRITDIAGPRDLNPETFRSLPPAIARAAVVEKNDLLLAAVGATYGKSYFHTDDSKPACYAGYLVRFSPGPAVVPDYMAYWTESSSYWDQLRSQVIQSTIQNFSSGRYQELIVLLPPLPEQRAIAAFLDERTARIDALVARKRRLVQLLKEKRQALITRAVTRGLDPKAKMKESGVPWLGEVPEGWEVKPLRNVATFQNGISAGADYFGSGYPFVNYKDVYQWPSLPEQVEGLANSTDIDQERYSVREGDIFFTRTSETNEEIGFASTCLRTMEHATFSGFLIRVRPHRGLLAPNFSKHFFRSDVHRAFFVKEMNLVTRASLGQDLLKRLPVLLPPVVEQIAIAEFLDDRLNRLDVLVTKVEHAVERLQEYRTALISAAVTGKVRVPVLITTSL